MDGNNRDVWEEDRSINNIDFWRMGSLSLEFGVRDCDDWTGHRDGSVCDGHFCQASHTGGSQSCWV